MPTVAATEKIQPCLFDRLIDEKPLEQKESRMDRVLSKNRYLEGVTRDLVWLLNCNTHLKSEGFHEFTEVSKSVLNFGQMSFAGVSLNDLEPQEVEKAIERAIKNFEPRIDPDTLKVRCVSTGGSGKGRFFKTHGTYNSLDFEISGVLWAHPIPEEFFLKTALDLESGLQVS